MFNIENEYKKEMEFSTIEGYNREGEKIESKSYLGKSLFTLFMIGAIGYFGYNYYIQEKKTSKTVVMGISVTDTSKDNLNIKDTSNKDDSLNRDDIEKKLDSLYQEEENDKRMDEAISNLSNRIAIQNKPLPTSSSKDITNELNGMVDMFYNQEAIPVELGNMVDDFYMEEPSSSTENSLDDARYTIVKQGDTLAKISQKFYGNALKYQKIINANERLKKNSTLHIGEKIRIPY